MSQETIDLTKDETACRLLRALSRKPWDKLRWDMLHDHVEWELGLDWPEDRYLHLWEHGLHWGCGEDIYSRRKNYRRRTMARHLATFRRVLQNAFGDFVEALKPPVDLSEIPF
jgi:hypothetical protein